MSTDSRRRTPTPRLAYGTRMPTVTAPTRTTSPCPTCPRRSTSSTPFCGTAASRRASPSPSTTSCGWPSSWTTSGSRSLKGGWPGANPKDIEFFARAKKELRLTTATLVAFGSTRRAGVKPETDAVLANLVEAGAPVACIVAKSWDRHVAEALRTSLDEAVAMVADSVRFLREHDLRVFLDAEHFFDGYRRNPDFALSVLAAAEEAGAEALVLCDTNGGSLPDDVGPGRGRRAGAHERTARHPLPQRCRLRGGQLAGGGAGRRHPGAGLHQRVRRAGGQHRPLGRNPEPVAEAQHPHHPGGSTGAADPGGAPHRRAGQHRAEPPTALRRELRLRPQGRPACQCRGAQRRSLRACRAQPRGQRDPGRRVGDGRALDPGHEGGRARARARRRGHRPRARRAQAAGARGLPLRGGGRLPGTVAAARHRLGGRLLHGGVLPRHHRSRSARRERWPPDRPTTTVPAS